jgi:hypothetical protein
MAVWERGGKGFNLLFIGFRVGLEEGGGGWLSCPVRWTSTANSVGKFFVCFLVDATSCRPGGCCDFQEGRAHGRDGTLLPLRQSP